MKIVTGVLVLCFLFLIPPLTHMTLASQMKRVDNAYGEVVFRGGGRLKIFGFYGLHDDLKGLKGVNYDEVFMIHGTLDGVPETEIRLSLRKPNPIRRVVLLEKGKEYYWTGSESTTRGKVGSIKVERNDGKVFVFDEAVFCLGTASCHSHRIHFKILNPVTDEVTTHRAEKRNVQEIIFYSSESQSGRFQDNGDGTAIDSKTGLMWTVRDSASDVNWNGANAYCQGLNLGGHSDWRMATIKELEELKDEGRSTPCGDWDCYLYSPFVLGGGRVWSSTKWGSSSSEFAVFNAYHKGGARNYIDGTEGYRALCVR